MRKRIIALLLALILTVGLLPTVALAAEGDGETSSTNAEVVIGKYNDKGQWEPGTPTSTLPDGVKTVSKTAKPTTNDNEYEVTLQVVLQQTEENSGKAATVLVLDTSGSMAYCAECGAEPEEDCEHNYVKFDDTPNSSTEYYYKTTDKNGREKFDRAYYCDGNHTKQNHNAGWFNSSKNRKHTDDNRLADNNIYVETTRTSRLDAAKVAAENFLKTYSGLTFKTDGTPANNQNNRNLGRYVSVVSFASGAAPKHNWIDVSNANNYQSVLNKIKALEPGGGTNLDAGLTYAEYLLKQTTVKDAVKNVIALTDGQPTYCLKKNCSDLLHLFNAELTIGNTKYFVHGNGKQCTDEIYNSTVATATRVKNVPSKIYTVCFDAGETIDVPDSQKKISVSEYLSTKIATQPTKTGEQFAYDADNAEQLYAEFAKITQSIVSGLNTGTVKDTLPTGITSEAFGKDKVKEWKLNEAPFTKNETPNTVGGKQVTTYTYTYTYTVKIDPKTVKTEKVDGVDYAPLNGKTTLTVKNSQGTDVEIPFPIPAGKVTMPSHTVTYTDGVDSEVVFENVEKTAAYKAAIPAYGDSNPTRTGYTFTSWKWYNATDTTYANEITPAPTTMPANNLVAVAQWTPATDTKYIVEHYLQNLTDDSYTLAETETKAGTTGAQTEAVAKSYPGFTVQSFNQQTIAADGTTVVEIHYNRNTYKVTYDYGTAPDGASDLPTEATYKYGATVPVADKATAPGYNFDGWKKDGTVTTSFEMPADNVTLTGTWTAKSDTAYQVKHYLQNLTDDGYTLAETETKAGTTGAQTEAVAKSYPGFTVQSFNQQTIAADGTTVVEIHYNRNTYKVTYDYGTAPDGASDLPTEATYKYGATVPVADKATAPGYNFDGWKKDGTVTTSFEMPAQNVTLTGSWTLKDPTAVNVDLNDHIYKTFTSNTADIPNGELTFNVTVSGKSDNAASMTQSGSVEFTKQDVEGVTTSKAFTFAGNPLTFTAAGEYTFEVVEDTTTTINGLTYNVNNEAHLFTIVVDKKENANELYVKEVRVGTAEYTGNALTATLAYATITNNYVEPKNAQVTNKEVVVTQPEGALKTAVNAFAITSQVTVLYPTGNGTTSNTLEVPYGTTKATLLYKITVFAGTKTYYEFDDVSAKFVYAEHANVAQVDNTFKVTFENGAEYAYVYVAVTHGLNFDDDICEVDNTVLGQTAKTTVKEKDPNSVTVDFSQLVCKKLTVTGSKAFTGATFEAVLDGEWHDLPTALSLEDASAIATYAHATPGAAQLHKTLTVSFDANDDLTQNKAFTGSITFNAEGVYTYTLKEVIPEGATGYDTSEFLIQLWIKANSDAKLEVKSVKIKYNNQWEDLNGIILFENTIDTGRDDYIPTIIPTIINKDTGMLNKTDHFAYVIGYPDGTVHPNGQITRAEVATIFFRLLRDEVRDGAFTTSNSYSDVAYGKWYNNPISTMSALGIITGYPDGTFKPNKPITRAEFAAIAARFDETQSGKSATFSDVIGHWAAKEIGIAYYNDWIKGYPDGTFKPDQNITRAEAMTLINRVLERKPESPADLLTNMNKWTDNMDTSKWYYLDVQEATNSHGYTRKTFNYELWRQMLPDPDWSRYER